PPVPTIDRSAALKVSKNRPVRLGDAGPQGFLGEDVSNSHEPLIEKQAATREILTVEPNRLAPVPGLRRPQPRFDRLIDGIELHPRASSFGLLEFRRSPAVEKVMKVHLEVAVELEKLAACSRPGDLRPFGEVRGRRLRGIRRRT
ncbi:MAG: hypothetical protein AAF725_27625, partial [Acidobacteriota bacterium]